MQANKDNCKIGDIWESPDKSTFGIIVGYKTDDTLIMEMLTDCGSNDAGDLVPLFNPLWNKKIPKVKRTIYIYYSLHTGFFYACESERDDHWMKLMETREYEMEVTQ